MRRHSTGIAVLVLLAVVRTGAAAPQAPVAAELGLRPTAGSSVRYRALATTDGELVLKLASGSPHTIRLVSRLELEMRLTFVEVRADALRVRQEILWLALSGQVSGGAYAFDSRKPAEGEAGDIYAPLFRSLRGLIGKPLDLDVKDHGRGVRYRPETLRALDQLGGLVEPEDLIGVVEAVFPPLPKAATLVVGAEEEHSRPVHLASFGQLDLGVRTRIASLSPELVELAVEFRPSLTPSAGAEMPVELAEAAVESAESSGTLRVRRSDGRNLGSRTALQLGLSIREADLEVKGSVRLGSELELLPD